MKNLNIRTAFALIMLFAFLGSCASLEQTDAGQAGAVPGAATPVPTPASLGDSYVWSDESTPAHLVFLSLKNGLLIELAPVTSYASGTCLKIKQLSFTYRRDGETILLQGVTYKRRPFRLQLQPDGTLKFQLVTESGTLATAVFQQTTPEAYNSLVNQAEARYPVCA